MNIAWPGVIMFIVSIGILALMIWRIRHKFFSKSK